MTEKLNIYQKMSAISAEIGVIPKKRPKNVPYAIVTHDDVTRITNPLFGKYGVLPIPDVTEHRQDGNRTVCTVETVFVNIDNPSENYRVRTFGYGIDTQDKGPGKAMSYAYKYAVLKALNLETGDDSDKEMIDYTKSSPSYGDTGDGKAKSSQNSKEDPADKIYKNTTDDKKWLAARIKAKGFDIYDPRMARLALKSVGTKYSEIETLLNDLSKEA